MLRKDLIFLTIVISWLIFGIFQVIFSELRIFNFVPVIILCLIILPRMINSRYNNWLETEIKQKHEPTLKEIRYKKLKRINRFKIFKI